jgi:arylsulfatase A-like enzyme
MHASLRHSFALLAAASFTAACGDAPVQQPPAAATAPATRTGPAPNIVMVLVDDLRWDEFGVSGHPYAETPNIDRLAAEGAMFVNAFHAVPLCSPNRASLLTGQYPSRHGIIDNVARDRASHRLETFPQALRAGGYETGFLGKWHMGNDPTPRPGFDYWVSFPGQGRTVDPPLFENGKLGPVKGYVTDLLTDRALDFIRKDRRKPFLVLLSHKAIHPDTRQLDDGSLDPDHPNVYIPAPRHFGRYEDKMFPRRGNVPRDRTGPSSVAVRAALEYRASDTVMKEFGAQFVDPMTSEETIRRRAEMLLAIDESVGRILALLTERGVLDQTVIVFTSDNGYFFGEHGFSIERRMPYDEAIRSPLLVRYPPMVKAGTRVDQLALSIDIAPTMLDLGGVPIGDRIQGRSLVPLLTGGPVPDWRSSVLVEFYTYENPLPWLMGMDYRAVRTRQYKYIHWLHHEDELYDIVADSLETRNLISEAGMTQVAAELRTELGRLSLEAIGLGPRRP